MSVYLEWLSAITIKILNIPKRYECIVSMQSRNKDCSMGTLFHWQRGDYISGFFSGIRWSLITRHIGIDDSWRSVIAYYVCYTQTIRGSVLSACIYHPNTSMRTYSMRVTPVSYTHLDVYKRQYLYIQRHNQNHLTIHCLQIKAYNC